MTKNMHINNCITKLKPKAQTAPYHDGVVGSGDECDEEGQHHVDEEGDDGVEVDLTEDPHQGAASLHLRERHKHVVPVDEREQALGHRGQGAELGRERANCKSSLVSTSYSVNQLLLAAICKDCFFYL